MTQQNTDPVSRTQGTQGERPERMAEWEGTKCPGGSSRSWSVKDDSA